MSGMSDFATLLESVLALSREERAWIAPRADCQP